ncbi:GPN-loop GTPase 2 isoform X1 [Equus przewalskii]|uniref:GPN-loop GTPase 2 n=1 Tax=Equus przewalskii TaxID=9798 RepID=A0ABM4NP46_EQUPR
MAGAATTTAFGQVVIGPPGSGKTTYCLGMSEFLRALGRRVAVVNLDPANEGLPYECAVDVGELVGLSDVMDALRLGPNGGLLYCMEYLEANLDWLRAKLDPLRGHYFLFDCPGQVELCTHHGALRSIFSQMAQWDLRLTAVHLVDSHYCTDPAKFISVLCTSLATMLHVELPHVNVLSKMDLIEHYGKLAFNLDYYTEVLDLSYLLDHLASDPFFRHYRQLNEKLVQLIEDYSLVSFIPLNIQISPELTTASPPLFAEEVRPRANICAYPPPPSMWDAYHSMACQAVPRPHPGSKPANPGPPRSGMCELNHCTTGPAPLPFLMPHFSPLK